MKTRRPTGAVPWPLILVEGSEKSGKAQPFHSRLMTPSGWTTMGRIAVGDQVIGSLGRPATVTQVHERGIRSIYRITFSDGSSIEACDEHLWATWTASERHRKYQNGPKRGQRRNLPPRPRTTEEIRGLALGGTAVHIPMSKAVTFELGADLPIAPYLLGLLLGDGCLARPNYPMFTPGDEPLFDALAEVLPAGDCLTRFADGITGGIKGGQTTAALRGLGLMGTKSGDKFIPDAYLLAPVADRLALLQGLMDTDGGAERRDARYCTVSPRLALHVRWLVESLGGTASTRTKGAGYRLPDGTRKECQDAYIVTVRLPEGMSPFRLERKAAAWRATRPTFRCPPRRTVRQVDYVGEMPARCITVDAEDSLYLTDHFVVTHNSWACAILSASDKVGQTYWIDLGEGSADEYGAIPGADYLIVEHDGSFGSIYAAVAEVHDLAQRELAAGGNPVVLVVDSMTSEWDWLKDWATDRAKGSNANKRKLAQDPAADITVSANYWNDANSRHRKLMRLLMTFPGIAVMTARGKLVASIGENGQPIEGKKEYRVEGQKTLAFDASCWVRLSRDEPAMVVGARSVHTGIRPGRDEPQTLADDWSLEWLIFEALKCDPAHAHSRALVDAKPERSPEQIRDEAVHAKTGFERLGELFQEAQHLGYESVVVPNERQHEELLVELIKRLGVDRKAQAPAAQQQHARMKALWKTAADFGDRDARLAFTSEIVGRKIAQSGELTSGEADQVLARLNAYIAQNTPPPAAEPKPEPAGASS